MPNPVFLQFLHRLSTAVVAIGIASQAHGQTCWLNSQYDTAGVHYATAEEACISGEVQRRLDIRQANSPLAQTADPDTGQCLVPKYDSDCPVDGGNPSNLPLFALGMQ